MSLSDRFELLDLLRQDMFDQEQVQTFRARERASGRIVEVHFLRSEAGILARLDDLSRQRSAVIDRGDHEGGFYIVSESVGALDSAGAWRIRPAVPPQTPAPQAVSGSEPGDFTRMFQLRQAPEPVAVPASIASRSTPAEPGEFTRVFQKPATAAPAAPASSAAPGQPGDFTRMFQQPARPAPGSAVSDVPAPLVPASHPKRVFIAIAIVLLSAIAVFVWMRKLY